jgi:hypothetical protein
VILVFAQNDIRVIVGATLAVALYFQQNVFPKNTN